MSTGKDVYDKVPVFENDLFLLRKAEKEKDCDDLLAVYSDTGAVPFFNSDNCHGDLFYYDTREKMERAMKFWEYSYQNRYFVRWAVIDKAARRAIGTIELFHRDSGDYFTNCGVLRLDLHSSYETEENILSVLGLILKPAYELFECDKIATKAVDAAGERIHALIKAGFEASEQKVKGNDGKTLYGDYYVRKYGKA